MATGKMSSVVRHLRRAALLQDGAAMTDRELLECFLAQREEAAFEALVRRHGPMVLGVCRRVLRNAHDADDAFQATFLVLVRKAFSLRGRETLGNWLYVVAYRTALKARAADTKRRAKEALVKDLPEPEARMEDTWQDLRSILDQELSRLPDKYREAVVLCHLEGKTRGEAARHLGIPAGTLSGRLTTARRILARRLTRRGLAPSSGLLAGLCPNVASACVPVSLVVSTVRGATLLTAGQVATGAISAKVATLTQGVVKAMLMTQAKMLTAVVLAVSVVGVGAGLLAYQTRVARQHVAVPAFVAFSPSGKWAVTIMPDGIKLHGFEGKLWEVSEKPLDFETSGSAGGNVTQPSPRSPGGTDSGIASRDRFAEP